ncbi:MAG: glycosyltransferase family 39 protein [Halioglobus sp.]
MSAFLDRTGKAVPTLLIALAGILYFYYIGERGLWPSDEDDYAQISREILRSGNWIYLTCNDLPWTAKPVLLNWFIAAISLPWGDVTELRARIPSAVAAIATVMLTYALGKRMFSNRAGLLSALVLGTCGIFIIQARLSQTYMLAAFFSTLAIFCFYVGYTNPARRTLAYLSMAAAAGFGVMTAGPVNLAVPGLVCLTFIVFMRDLGHIKEMRLVRGMLVFLVIVAPWYVMMGLHEDYGYDLFIKTNFVRYTDTWTHAKPFYYYLKVLTHTFAPWSLFLPGALILAFSQRSGEHRKAITFILVWVFSLYIFFSIATGKKPGYLLGAYPALALLVGYLLDRALQFWPESFYRKALLIPSGILIALSALATVAAPIASAIFEPDYLIYAIGLSLITGTFALLSYLAWRRNRPGQLVVLPAALVFVLVLYGAQAIIPLVDPYKSAKVYSEYVRSQLDEDPGTAWGMYKSYRAKYVYYADHFNRALYTEKELRRFLKKNNPAIVTFHADDYDKMKTTLLADLEVLDRQFIGSQEFVSISNRSSLKYQKQ